jgi:hypothetical protein
MTQVDEYSIYLARDVCQMAGDFDYIANAKKELREAGIENAIHSHDTEKLFDWLLRNVNLQGVSDRAALTYLKLHGSPTWSELEHALRANNRCQKLLDHWHFVRCGYEKNQRSCNCMPHFRRCPLPRHDLRNGRLNQTAYSLFFFIRDIANGDLVDWIDRRLALKIDGATELGAMLIQPLRSVFGVSDKVLNMSLSTLLVGGRAHSSHWFSAGIKMVAIDSLVHNFLHRTGILRRCDREHLYGTQCYAPGGCASIIEELSRHIDARKFNRTFPSNFPRFIQHSLWRYCAQDELNICNGIRVRDGARCRNGWCRLHDHCDRVTLTRRRQKRAMKGDPS